MRTAHHAYWPAGQPHELSLPATSVFANLEISARRSPEKAATLFYDSAMTYATLRDQAERLAGFLQQRCGVERGDRVLVHMQNSPQWVVAFYAVLRADAMVMPVSPALLTEELRHIATDAGARVASPRRTSGLGSRRSPEVAHREGRLARPPGEGGVRARRGGRPLVPRPRHGDVMRAPRPKRGGRPRREQRRRSSATPSSAPTRPPAAAR
ncbi:MAG TPA: AMP-binding protein, partial [Anaeromyxobacter sp.]